MHTRRTLTLTQPGWDITLDAIGRIDVTSGDLATAQAVANDARLFTEDAYFVQDQGIPHYAVELGQRLTPDLIRSFLYRAAMRVEGVISIHSPRTIFLFARCASNSGKPGRARKPNTWSKKKYWNIGKPHVNWHCLCTIS